MHWSITMSLTTATGRRTRRSLGFCSNRGIGSCIRYHSRNRIFRYAADQAEQLQPVYRKWYELLPEENYEAGTAEFKKAIELDGSEEKAYEQYIQAYIDATNKAEEAGTESTLNLDDALTLVSNRISSKHGGVEKNSAVLYKLALTYFEEERSYSQAAKYFGMIDEKDEEYGKLAGFYNHFRAAI